MNKKIVASDCPGLGQETILSLGVRSDPYHNHKPVCSRGDSPRTTRVLFPGQGGQGRDVRQAATMGFSYTRLWEAPREVGTLNLRLPQDCGKEQSLRSAEGSLLT